MLSGECGVYLGLRQGLAGVSFLDKCRARIGSRIKGRVIAVRLHAHTHAAVARGAGHWHAGTTLRHRPAVPASLMSAHLLGAQAYKYVPFGPVDEVMPFLVRRAQENGDVLGNAGRELSMLRGELARRLTPQLPRAFAAAA